MSHRGPARRRLANRLVRRVRPALEILEDRTLPSASLPVSIASPYGDGWSDSRILVQFKPQYANQATSLSGTQLGQTFAITPGLFEVQLSPGVTVDQALAEYKNDNRVLYAQPDFKIQVSRVPNDPSYGSLWGMSKIAAPTAWDTTTGSSSIVVGVIDTGVDYNHPDLAANMWHNPGEIPGNGIDDDHDGIVDDYYGANFVAGNGNPMDDNDHGTHVSGTIGAVGNNGVGVVGVNWNVKIMALKFLDASGSGYTSNAISAINFAVAHGAKILNNSWGGGGYDSAMYNAIVAAKNAGVIFVAAAGNSAANNDTGSFYPANYNVDNVVSVAATTSSDTLASFSNYGPNSVDLAAPGVGILSTTPSNTYSSFSGTSMATPHVTGAMALVWAAHPTFTYKQVIDAVLNNVDRLSSLTGKVITGGRLNVAKAIAGSGPDVTGPRVTSSAWLGSGNSVNQVQFTFSEAIAAGTFTTADISSFTGPGGANLLSQVTGVAGSGTTWTVSFNTQTAVGSYSMTVGPDILDTASPGNKMDQNGNGVNGEVPGDRYTSTYSLDGTYTFSSTDVPKNIYDLQTTVSVLTINQDITIKDLNVKFYVTHTWDSDLRIRLRAPDNTLLTLVQYRGGSGDNFGNSTTYCTIDDEAATAISSGMAPFAGSYRPEVGGELWRLDNKNARGTWKLEIYDSANLDTGMLRAWQLVITPNNGGAGKKSIAAGEGDLFNLPIERNRPMSFVSTSPSGSSVRSDDDDVRAAAAEGTELRAVNHLFADPGPLFTSRHSTSCDPLATLFDGNTDLAAL